MLFYLGHIVKDKVDENVRIGTNKIKGWKYGYNEEFDIIIISKTGKLGSIYFINGIYIGFPEPPTDRKEILNWNKTPKGQKWERTSMPSGLNSKTQYNQEFEEYIEKEEDKKIKGVWIYLKGNLVYLTGLAYYFYQWNKIDVGYPSFRIIQLELMIFWEAVKADYRCYGICYVKNRRFGWSTICNAEILYSATLYEDKEFGIISKEGGDARKLFGRLVRTFKKLPPFFQPAVDGNTTPKKELIFSEPNRKKKREEDNDDIEEGLDSVVRWHTTTLNAMDGDAIFRSALDEVGKYPKECRFDAYWNVVKTSHTVGEDITGKAMVGSTVNHLDKGGREFKKVYDTSDPYKRTDNNETLSGLYKLFIPAEYGIQGYYDTYGFSIIEDPETPIKNGQGRFKKIGAITYLENKFRALKGEPDILNEEYRKFPRKESHAFRASSEECEFNLMKIVEQIEYNDEELEDRSSEGKHVGNDDIERGNFMWKGGVQDTEVIWNPDPTNGRFWIKKGCHPPLEFRNKKEKQFKNGVTAWSPIGAHLGAFGVDPYNRDKSADGRGSKGAIHLSTTTNTSELPNDTFILEYIDRAKKVTIFFEEVLMAMVYYSIPMLSELSNEAFLQYVLDRGYRHFSLNNPFKPYKELNPTEKKLGGAPAQNSKIADQQFYAIEAYIEDRIGVAHDNRNRLKGQMGDMPFTRTLEQWKEVDLADRTKYDAYISSSLSRLGCQRRIKKKQEVKRVQWTFRKYDTTGNISKAI